VSPGLKYRVAQGTSGHSKIYSGEELAKGIPVKLAPGELLRIEVSEL